MNSGWPYRKPTRVLAELLPYRKPTKVLTEVLPYCAAVPYSLSRASVSATVTWVLHTQTPGPTPLDPHHQARPLCSLAPPGGHLSPLQRSFRGLEESSFPKREHSGGSGGLTPGKRARGGSLDERLPPYSPRLLPFPTLPLAAEIPSSASACQDLNRRESRNGERRGGRV